jgi:hypothetical protein
LTQLFTEEDSVMMGEVAMLRSEPDEPPATARAGFVGTVDDTDDRSWLQLARRANPSSTRAVTQAQTAINELLLNLV